MLRISALLLAILFPTAILTAQGSAIDSALAKRITINGFCLCNITLSDLQHMNKNFVPVEVEEENASKRCPSGGGDSRYENGKGYYSDSFPGMIFQKDQYEDLISKIRLTRKFRGRLPNGAFVDVSNLLLKDALKLYPDLKGTTTECSDFWYFSNDTIGFLVRIDTTRKPKYPMDEAYYNNRPVDGVDLFISCYSLSHKNDEVSLFNPGDPMYFIDSIRTNSGFLKNYSPNEIAFIDVFKNDARTKKLGDEARNGVVFIITKEYARQEYWDAFRSKFPDYRKQIPDLKAESTVVYILDGSVIAKDQEMVLFKLKDQHLKSLKVLDHATLVKKYSITDRSIGVEIDQ